MVCALAVKEWLSPPFICVSAGEKILHALPDAYWVKGIVEMIYIA